MVEFLKIFVFMLSIFLGLFLIGGLCGLLAHWLGPIAGIIALLVVIAFLLSLIVYTLDKDVR